jgi:hypothetical protein
MRSNREMINYKLKVFLAFESFKQDLTDLSCRVTMRAYI